MTDTKRNRKILLKEVLSDVNPEELKNFILYYAKKDNGFELALKSHFISRIQVGDQDTKYRRILGEIIKPKSSSNSKIGQTNRKIISLILVDFANQMADLLSKENYTEAFYIIKNSLDKIAYAETQFDLNGKGIEETRLAFLSGLEVILKQEIAPAFRATVEGDLLELVFKSYYLPKEKNIISSMNEEDVFTSKDKKKLITSLLNKRDKIEDQVHLVSILLSIAHPFENLIKRIQKEFKSLIIYQALVRLIHQGNLQIPEFILEHDSLELHYNKEVLELLLLDKKKDFKRLSKKLPSIKTDTYTPLVIQQIVDGLSEEYLCLEIEKLEPWITQLSTGHQCKLYAKGKLYDKLVAVLKAQNDIEWLKAYDRFLLNKGKEKELKELYLHIVQSYMENHLGKQARAFLDKFDARLTLLGEQAMLFEIKEVLMENFGHRNTFTIF